MSTKPAKHERLLALTIKTALARGIVLTPDHIFSGPDAIVAVITEVAAIDSPIGVAILRSARALADYFAAVAPLVANAPEGFSLDAYGDACVELGEAYGMTLVAHLEMFELASAGDKRRAVSQRAAAKTAKIKGHRKSDRLAIIEEIIAAKPTLRLKDIANHLRSELSRMGTFIPRDRTMDREISAVKRRYQRKFAN